MIAVRNRMDHRGVASTLIWVDALCINQEDPVERSHQVNLMSDIYSQAQLVVVWLGPEAENSGLAMRYIEKVSNSMRSYASTKRDTHTNDITNLSEAPQSLPKRQYPSHFADSKLASEWRLDKTLCDAISALCDRAYWSRLWVLQEIVLARNILVLCGPETCKWKAFEVLADVEEREKLPDIFDLPAIRTIERRIAWHREGKPAKTLDYLLLYGSPERLQCAEPRDKVFGLLGLLEHSPRAMLGVLEADYAKSATEIFCDILCYMKDKPEWIDPPGEAITGIGRAGVARTIMGVLMLLLGLEDEHAEGTRALIAESFPIARTTYSSTL
ncbi:hypothetical protein Vi05172_g11237 [Venturia inaequalis]|nr:hypothetical protein Vi05172_g11237 [Venturia inaequalis]